VKNNAKKCPGCVLGIEGGGTKTTWVLMDQDGKNLAQGALGPGNFYSIGLKGMRSLFRQIRSALPSEPERIGICLAGCTGEEIRARVLNLARSIFPRDSAIVVGEDTESGFWAAHGAADGILIIAGTGSNVVGRRKGRILKAGGWGFLLGDPGSAYDVAILALRQIYSTYDQTGQESPLAKSCLRHAGAASLPDLVSFVYEKPGKEYVASFAQVVFSEAEKGNREAKEILRAASSSLALTAKGALKRLGLRSEAIALTGGLFEKSERYVRLFRQSLKALGIENPVFVCRTPGHVGAARFAMGRKEEESAPAAPPSKAAAPIMLSSIPTEQRNQRSRHLEKRTVEDLVELFLQEEKYVRSALFQIQGELVKAASLVSTRLKQGGRLIYVGAGTSGRLGVLDASEMPPTFGVSPELVQGIIAGGFSALTQAREGAEDDREAGTSEMLNLRLSKKDVVVGIAASGRTPFVLAALETAGRMGADTVLLTCNPAWKSVRFRPDVGLHVPTGAELISGSTRLKAGTATKIILNLLSSIAMIRLGKVKDNLMIDLQVTNEKLAARAVHLVRELHPCTEQEAESALSRAHWNIRRALLSLQERTEDA